MGQFCKLPGSVARWCPFGHHYRLAALPGQPQIDPSREGVQIAVEQEPFGKREEKGCLLFSIFFAGENRLPGKQRLFFFRASIATGYSLLLQTDLSFSRFH